MVKPVSLFVVVAVVVGWLAVLGAASTFTVSLGSSKFAESTASHLVINMAFTADASPVTWDMLMVMHGRRMHIMFVSRDLEYFLHVHPEDLAAPDSTPGQFRIPVLFPRSGMWRGTMETMVMWHNHTTGEMLHESLLVQFLVTVEGPNSMQLPVKWTKSDFLTSKRFSSFALGAREGFTTPVSARQTILSNATVDKEAFGVQMRLSTTKSPEIRTCYALELYFTKDDQQTPHDDLSLFLSMPVHALVVHEGLNDVQHLHGDYVLDGQDAKLAPNCSSEVHDPMMPMPTYQNRFGPRLVFQTLFTTPGNFRIFIQTAAKDGTRMYVPSFMVRVGRSMDDIPEDTVNDGQTDPSVDVSSFSLGSKLTFGISCFATMIVSSALL
eukprot:ANDGO_08406.mRNA.1 hypothetical protein